MSTEYELDPQFQARTITQQVDGFRHQRHLEIVKLAVLDGLPSELRTESWQGERDAIVLTIARYENALDTLHALLEQLPEPGPPTAAVHR